MPDHAWPNPTVTLFNGLFLYFSENMKDGDVKFPHNLYSSIHFMLLKFDLIQTLTSEVGDSIQKHRELGGGTPVGRWRGGFKPPHKIVGIRVAEPPLGGGGGMQSPAQNCGN